MIEKKTPKSNHLNGIDAPLIEISDIWLRKFLTHLSITWFRNFLLGTEYNAKDGERGNSPISVCTAVFSAGTHKLEQSHIKLAKSLFLIQIIIDNKL